MTGGASNQAAPRIAFVVKGEARGRLRFLGAKRQAGVVGGDHLAFAGRQFSRNPAHLGMIPPTLRIILKLAFQITGIQPRKSRRARTVAQTLEAVAGKAGVARACIGTAHRDETAGRGQPLERAGLGLAAGAQQRGAGDDQVAHKFATARSWHLFPLAAVALGACKPPPNQQQVTPIADPGRGKAVIVRVGCASCHTIPGIGWPQGKAGPDLGDLGQRALIAGKIPNRPDMLAAYIRNAPALVADSGMPAMPVSNSEATDIVAYLFEQGEK